MESEQNYGLPSRNCIALAVFLILTAWWPFARDWRAIQMGCFFAISVATWWLLWWIWKSGKVGREATERFEHSLWALVAGAFLVMAAWEGSTKSHLVGELFTQMPGPEERGHVIMLLFLAVGAFSISVGGEYRDKTSPFTSD